MPDDSRHLLVVSGGSTLRATSSMTDDEPTDLYIDRVEDDGTYRVVKHEGTPEFHINGVDGSADPIPWGVKEDAFYNVLKGLAPFEATEVPRED
jgi:hypothetical protein